MSRINTSFALLSALVTTVFNACVAAPEARQAVNLFSYNIRHSTPADGDQDWQYRREHVTALLQFHDADIVATQEARKHQVDDIVADTGFQYSGVGKIDGEVKGSFTAIFFAPDRFTRMEDGHFWLSETPEKPSIGWDSETERLCCWIKLKDGENGTEFFIFNVHMDHQAEVARREGANLMKEKIAEIAGSAPVIVTGDMNAQPDTEPISIYKSFLSDAREISATIPYGPAGTFNGFDHQSDFARRLDYIFVSEQFRVLKFGVLTDSYNRRFPSDHLPVLARIVPDKDS